MKIYETLDNGIKIVEYHPSLAQTIAEMWNQSGEDWGGDSSIKTAAQVISEHETATHFNVYIALDGDVAVGYCSFGRYFYDSQTTYVYLLGVRPDYKGKKIGKALVLQCVQRTIELGYPRVDLFTWAGNTDAVPLYKKCGFMWEDRPDGVHLANYIPTIVTTPLFADFFAKADWYNDSTRSLEITPDGVNVNKFELFTYKWEKDGEMLEIGYERSGRQMYLAETNDYKVELKAGDHELAFGAHYDCEFVITNKSGKPLNVKVDGLTDQNITLDYSADVAVTDTVTLPAKFYVGEREDIQDLWRTHPCVLAKVEINGHAVTFGLGIEAKFPLIAKLRADYTVPQTGAEVPVHISLAGALAQDAEVTFTIPKTRLYDMKERKFTLDVPARGKTSVQTTAIVGEMGFDALKVDCVARLKDGTVQEFTTPLDIFNQDFTHAFHGETMQHYFIFNGPWRLNMGKNDENEVYISHITNGGYHCNFDPPKFGKPYDDEFNLLKPNVKMYQSGLSMVMEVEFVSEKFPGMVVTQVYTLSAAGLITRANRIENRGDKAQRAMLQDSYWLGLGYETMYTHNGDVTHNRRLPVSEGAVGGIDADGFGGNWVFEASAASPMGFTWPAEYEANIMWGSKVSFEIDTDELAPGQVYETKPVVYALGLFTNYNDFRNFAQNTYGHLAEVPTHTVDVVLNGYNPFISSANTVLDVINNRERVLEGAITVSSTGVFADETQTNPEEDMVERNTFALDVSGATGVQLASVDLKTVSIEADYKRVMFFPQGEITCTKEGSLRTVTNGEITFQVDPEFGNVCHSLTDKKGQEWLLSKYPNHEPYSWFNPFLGGIRVNPPHAYSAVAILKEKRSAEFVERRDNHGNLWKGICLTLEVTEFDLYKGGKFHTYFMTQPGVPVLCTFFEFENGTGEYKHDEIVMGAYLTPGDATKAVMSGTSTNGAEYRFRLGSEDFDELNYANCVRVKGERDENFYLFHGNSSNAKQRIYAWGNNKIPFSAGAEMPMVCAAGETFTSRPKFHIITAVELPQGSLDDLERLTF